MASLPELVLIDLFNGIVERVKQTQPARTDGKPLSGGLVYSQLVLGMPIDPRDYSAPWNPIGAASAGAPKAVGVPVVKGQPDPNLLRALEAAFKTSQLCNIMLQVTDDGSYLQYPVGRHLAFSYGGVLGAMQPKSVPPPPSDVQQAIDAAVDVLYEQDKTDSANPVIIGKSALYSTYTKNAKAYAKAKADYALGMAKTLGDPSTANVWPQISSTFQQTVDDAFNTWKTEGAEKIERALAVYESQGINLQQAQIAKAKKLMDVWSLGLAGVPTDIPYSYVDPSEWCDPTVDDIGFEQLTIKRTSQDHFVSSVTDSNRSMYWNNEQSSTTQNSHVGFAFYSANENSSVADQHAANGDSSAYTQQTGASNSFTDLEVDLEWGLVTIYRPWLISDLFYMNNWYIQGEYAGCVSDGEIQTQVRKMSDKPMLPMIPQQMLVVRNVSISSSDWGDNKDALTSLYSGDQGTFDASQVSYGGGGSFAFGPVSAGGGFQHSDNKAGGQGSGYTAGSAFARSSANFDGTTLKINGSQVIAFLSDIVPNSPTMDDAVLPKKKPVVAGPVQGGGAQPPAPVPVPA